MEQLNAELVRRLRALHVRARHDDRARIAKALSVANVTGVRGEAEVGLTALTDAVLREQTTTAIRVDLDGAASFADVVWMLARGLARLVVEPRELALAGLPAGLRPSSADRVKIALQRAIGPSLAELALADAPYPDADEVLTEAFDRLERFAERTDVVVWIDHLEAPRLTPRHPVDVGALLWDVRARQQRTGLRVVLSCREPAVELAAGRRAAFYGDGEWVTIGRPGHHVWMDVAEHLWPSARQPDALWVHELHRLLDGHPASMLLALADAYAGRELVAPVTLVERLVIRDDGLVGRALQHARSLHRLGGQVLMSIAESYGPYERAGAANHQEIARAVRMLHLAGLITRPRPRAWRVTNPLLAARLSGGRWPLPAADDS